MRKMYTYRLPRQFIFTDLLKWEVFLFQVILLFVLLNPARTLAQEEVLSIDIFSPDATYTIPNCLDEVPALYTVYGTDPYDEVNSGTGSITVTVKNDGGHPAEAAAWAAGFADNYSVIFTGQAEAWTDKPLPAGVYEFIALFEVNTNENGLLSVSDDFSVVVVEGSDIEVAVVGQSQVVTLPTCEEFVDFYYSVNVLDCNGFIDANDLLGKLDVSSGNPAYLDFGPVNPASVQFNADKTVAQVDVPVRAMAGTPNGQPVNVMLSYPDGANEIVSVVTLIQEQLDPAAVGCNDQINVTLDENCRIVIMPDMVGEGDVCNNGNFTVIVYDGEYPLTGPDNKIEKTGIFNYVLMYGDDEYCWGKVNAEDKKPPVVETKPEKVNGIFKYKDHYGNYRFTPYGLSDKPGSVFDEDCPETANEEYDDPLAMPQLGIDTCFEDIYCFTPGTFEFNRLVCDDVDEIYQVEASWSDPDYPYFVGYPYVDDGCGVGGVELVSVEDWLEERPCEYREDQVTAVIKRTFTFRDAMGNKTSSTQEICFRRPVIILPDCKIHVDLCAYEDAGGADDLLSPGNLADLAQDGEETVPYYFNGICEKILLDDHQCDLTISYEDQEFPAPCGKKIVRTWSILDWCWEKQDVRGRYSGSGTCYADLFYEDSREYSYAGKQEVEFEQQIIMGAYNDMVIECQDVTVTTGPFNCTAVVAPQPPTISSCVTADFEFEVWGYVADPKTGLEEYELIGHSIDGKLSGVPKGVYDLFYRIEDECGRLYTGITKGENGEWEFDWDKACTLTVRDEIEPVAICDDDLNVSLGGGNTVDGGIAVLHAADVDEGSWDNCGPVKLYVRRLVAPDCIDQYESLTGQTVSVDGYTPYAPEVYFTCCDLGAKITVELLVVDDADMDGIFDPEVDNTNTCWLELEPEDKLPPRCVVEDATISCLQLDFDPRDSAQVADRFGAPQDILTIYDNCNNFTFTEAQTFTPDNCGTGSLARTITVRNGSGMTASCTQLITITEVNDYTIKFPGDLESSTCGLNPKSGLITAETNACDILAINQDTTRFEASGDECFKQLITYRVINWCEYDGESLEPTIIPRDVDEDDDLSECTLLEATYETNIRESYPVCGGEDVYVPDDAFVVKVYDADEDGNKKSEYPVKIMFRADCFDQNDELLSHVGPLVLRVKEEDLGGYYGKAPCYVPYCPTGTGVPTSESEYEGYVEDLCRNLTYQDQCWTPGYFEYTQLVKVYDNEAPMVRVMNDTTFCAYGDPTTSGVFPCGAPVNLSFIVDDACTPTKADARNVRLLVNGDPTSVMTTASGLFTVTKTDTETNMFTISAPSLPVGRHAFVLSAVDGCGNVEGVRIEFEVQDCKTPAPICINLLSVDLMPTEDNDNVGMNTVWATDFIASPLRDCTPHEDADILADGQNDVKYFVFSQRQLDSMGVDGITADSITVDSLRDEFTSVVFTCEDMPNQVVYIFGLDGAGNFDYCTAMATIMPGNDVVCGEGEDDGDGGISGLIITEEVDAVSEVSIQLSGETTRSYMTDHEGNYRFGGLIEGYDYSVVPKRDHDYLNGVSTFDLVLISKHILGVKPLGSPYKMIAADVNNSRSITTLDLIQLRKLILNAQTEFSSNTSWRFVSADYRFPDPGNPWSAPFLEVLNINNLSGELSEQDFVAIKVGDVNGSALPNQSASSEIRGSEQPFVLKTQELDMVAGNEYTVTFTAENLSAIEGYQFTLNFDRSGMELVDVGYGLANEEHFAFFPEDGMVTTSWNATDGKEGHGTTSDLFSLIVKPKQDVRLSEVLSIGSRLTRAEAYSTDGDRMDVTLHFGGHSLAKSGFQLYQNVPNPFSDHTLIGFELPHAAEASLKIQDVNGRVLREISGEFAKGYNEIQLDRATLPSGVLYYLLETEEHTASKKMVLIK